MITTSRQTAYSYTRRVLALPLIMLVLTLFSVKLVNAQTDPKLHPGDSIRVTKLTLLKAAPGKKPGDSTADVTIDYITPNGSTGVLKLSNVGYSKNDSVRVPRITLEDGTTREITGQEVREWAERIINNPPDVIYYVNGEETPKDKIKKLDIATIVTANTLHGDEAVAKYGEKARKGIILFTTR
jgi:hypothetical protein